jgi:hypothetical protein
MDAGDRDPSQDNGGSNPSAEKELNRRRTERRIHESKGYTYISMVGWMDRREKKRRRDDAHDEW